MKSKRILSLILAIGIIIGAIPIGEIVAWANGEATVTNVEVRKTYSGPQKLEVTYIEVKGKNLNNLGRNAVIARDKMGEPIALTIIESNNSLLYYKIEDMEGVSTISVDGEPYDIGGEKMPSVNSISPTTGIVKNDETMTIIGGQFNTFVDKNDGGTKGEINFYNNTGSVDKSGIVIKENEIEKTFQPSSPGGAYRLEFKYVVSENGKAPLTLIDNYVDLFTVHGKLGVSDEIFLVPNQGPTGTRIKIIGKELLQPKDMSVFFLKTLDGSDPYTVNNMGIDETYRQDVEKEKDSDEKPTLDVFTVKVPEGLDQGRYYVVLTNNVNEGVDPAGKITNVRQLDDMFTVIDSDDTISVDDVDPPRGPESGIDTTIHGRYIGSISENVFSPNDNSELKINGGNPIDTSSNILEITYEPKDNTNPIGIYKLIGGDDGVKVNRITRKITVFIGGRTTFRNGSSFTADVDKLEVRVPSVNIQEGESREKEVAVNVETIIDYEGMDKPHIITESGIWQDGKFIFDPINYRPQIERIVPERIPVDGNNEIIGGLEVHITGKNFFAHRYTDKETGEVKLKKPVIYLGGQVILDPNIDEETETDGVSRVPIFSENIKILDSRGNIIDGTPTNNLGTKISIKIPSGVEVDEGVLNQISRLRVRNPIKNDKNISKNNPEEHLGFSTQGEIRFVKVGADKTPAITDISPNIITTDGQNGIKIKGSNFDRNVKVYLDGVEIRGVQRNGTGTELTFNAPPKPEGIYQIIVQNEEGGLATYDEFVYTKTYTDIKLTDFNPKKGSANTLVTVKGENFVQPDPLVFNLEGIGINKLIGTRVLLGGQDVNKYSMENGKITLQDYASSDDNKIIRIEDGRLKLSDYYHSVILEEKINGTYYTIFFDTFSGQVKLTDGDKITYILEKKVNEDKIIAKRDGQEYDLTVNKDSLEINGKTLKFRTPYEVEKDEIKGDKITGNKVKVINKNELIFIVPPMPREGYYDLTVINPDTKRDSKTGNNGFWYNYQPDIKPIIKEINPNEGSVDGEYYINISGEGFIDNGGDNKTSVIIGSLRVPPKDVEVLVDGKTLKVKVPKYPGNLASETDMDRKSVAVVVVNPDGGSDSMEDGFSYIIPISHPRIDRLILNKGSAAGGDSIIIEGSGFRFFEPFKDLNNNSQWDVGEPFTDLNRPKNPDSLYKPKWDDLRYWLSNANKEKYDELAKDYENLVKPILPKVYFGGKEVEIIDFTASTIEVKTPRGEQGSIEVYLVNNDHGVSNKLNYNYEASNPKITSITPSTGRRQGKDKIEILGEGFHESNVKVIQGKSSSKNQDLQVIQFGSPTNTNMSNSNIPLDAPENSGRIRDRLTTVKVGNLTVKYDGTKDIRKLSFSIIEDKIEYKLEDVDYDDGEIFLPVDLLKNSQGEGYKGYEYVRVMLERVTGATTTRRLRVDRGFSPKASLVNPSQALVETPSYYTVGKVPVALINPDGGKTTGNFEYRNPDSNPVITDIKRDGESGYDTDDGRTIVEVPYSGGNLMEIIGRDFRKPVKVKIGDFTVNAEIEYEPENESPSNKLIFTMPAVDEKYIGEYLRVVVENEDGGVATSEPIYIHFTRPESLDMEITKVTPNFGPTAGGTRVTIEGKDFRQTMDGKNGELKVYFGKGINQVRVPSEDIISVSFDKIVLKTPPYTAGLTDIKVENPDGNIVTLKDAFNYVSSPRIISVVDPDNDKFIKETLSIEGGERVKIIGNDFMEGARVIFNPVLKLVEDDSQATGDIVTIDDKKYIILSGSPGTEVERVDGQTILTTTPAGKLGDKGVIVVNPDKGGTNVYNVVYGIPEMASPFDVRAEIVFDQFIRVNWTGPKDAVEYEIHMSQNGGKFEFIGTTELNSYAVQKLKPDTKYQFLIKAMGKYGTSKPIDESKSNIVTTGKEIGPIDIHGKPAEKTEIKRNGGQVDVIIGSKDFTAKGIVIDLTKGELVGVKDLTIRIPASVVSSSIGKIQVLGKDYRMNFQPKIFKTSALEANKSKNDAGVVFKISSHNENIDLKPGQTIVGGRYNLEAVTYVDKELSEMDYINGKINFVLDQDALIIKNRKLQNIKLVRYDNSSKTWVDINSENRLGLYTLIGSRR